MNSKQERKSSVDSINHVEFYEVMQADLRGQSKFFPASEAMDIEETDQGVPVGRTAAIITLVALAVAVALLTFIVIGGIRAAVN